jgi:hypothetical protein
MTANFEFNETVFCMALIQELICFATTKMRCFRGISRMFCEGHTWIFLDIPVKVESPGASATIAEDVAQQFMRVVERKGLSVPECYLQLVDVFKNMLQVDAENLPSRLLAGFTDDGMRIPIRYEHRPPKDGSRSCVWKIIPFEPRTGWVYALMSSNDMESQVSVHICDPNHCLWTLE